MLFKSFGGNNQDVQVPSPLALVVGGSWTGHLAGGRLPLPSWPSNPQFMLSTQQRAQVMVTLVRTDLRHAVIKKPQLPGSAIGLAIVEVCHLAEANHTGSNRRCFSALHCSCSPFPRLQAWLCTSVDADNNGRLRDQIT
jgi:hypothetical protein